MHGSRRANGTGPVSTIYFRQDRPTRTGRHPGTAPCRPAAPGSPRPRAGPLAPGRHVRARPQDGNRYAENARQLLITAAGEHDPSGQPSRHVMHLKGVADDVLSSGPRAADRDEAIAALFHACYPGLVRAGFAVAGDWDVAGQLAQEAFLRLWRRWRWIRDPGAAPAYLRRTVVTLSRARIRDTIVTNSGLDFKQRIAVAPRDAADRATDVDRAWREFHLRADAARRGRRRWLVALAACAAVAGVAVAAPLTPIGHHAAPGPGPRWPRSGRQAREHGDCAQLPRRDRRQGADPRCRHGSRHRQRGLGGGGKPAGTHRPRHEPDHAGHQAAVLGSRCARGTRRGPRRGRRRAVDADLAG
jgi:DNA-directed RNA polymerase specialized sigma24 family protein